MGASGGPHATPAPARGRSARGRGAAAALVVSASVAAAALVPACGADDAPADASRGARVYAQSCASCHGPDGRGGLGPALGGGATVEKYTEAEERALVARGGAKMPPMSAQLSEAQIAEVVAFVRADLGRTKGRTTPSATATTAPR